MQWRYNRATMPRLDQGRCVATTAVRTDAVITSASFQSGSSVGARIAGTTEPGERCKNRADENHLCEQHQHLATTALWKCLAEGGGKIALWVILKQVLERIIELFLQGHMNSEQARVPQRLAERVYAPGVDLARVEYELLVWFTEQDERIQHQIQIRVGR